MQMKKRGVSDVVTTVLVVLLSLVAIGIVGAYITNFVRDKAGDISSSCISLDVRPVSCSWNQATQNATVRYERGSGEANLVGLSAIFTVSGDNRVVNLTRVPGVLEAYTQQVSGLGAKPSQLALAGYVATQDGSSSLCQATQPIACS